MSEHYFSQKPQSKSSPKTWSYRLRENEYAFTSDYGVFSKNEIDYGSRLLIKQYRDPQVSGNVLDLGSGYGPIGIVIANTYSDRNVVLADVNERALHLAEQNAVQNKVKNVEFIKSDRFSNLADYTFASIVTNPPIRAGKKVVHAMIEESKSALDKDGELWVVIQKKQGAPSAKEKLMNVFGNVEVIAKDKGYFLLKAVNV
ncbi:class I SAM-dependent methyltransferase [Virgibacillus necropolis]|uniref:16S rRNA methyltransferase n=1 Tax=Virgibacillus necropolis TaxID=163877 RepID=A0A221M7T1_9BACI|nr:class I SAM-dependent methyltransferase [Virgibacillus necropolis]ASN03692.1 16S rRNA methyltransferase [Virgibacillus necropolis]